MDKEKKISFSVSNNENILTVEDIENCQFKRIHCKIYSADRINAHNYTCSLKVLKKYANTIAGKPVLVWYNKYANGGKGDFAGHEDSVWAKQYPVGFFPENAKVTYEKDKDGTIFLCSDAYIWSLYYDEIIKVFEDYGGIKGVSCEMLVIDSEIIDDTDIENIIQYSFTGLTLLGETDALGSPIKPAVDGCQAELVANSVTIDEKHTEYEKAKIEFEKILYNSINQESIKSGSFFNEKNKEKIMETEINKNSASDTSANPVENATQEVTTRVSVSTDTYNYDDDGHYVGNSYESHTISTAEIKEVPESDVKAENSETVTNAADKECKTNNSSATGDNSGKVCNSSTISIEEFEALKTKCSDLENEIALKNAEYEKVVQKCSSLEAYKNDVESRNTKNTIELALNSVSHILSADQITQWRKESEKCSAQDVDGFVNKLKAFAFDLQEKNEVIQTDTLRNSIPKETDQEPADFWERMEKKYV